MQKLNEGGAEAKYNCRLALKGGVGSQKERSFDSFKEKSTKNRNYLHESKEM